DNGPFTPSPNALKVTPSQYPKWFAASVKPAFVNWPPTYTSSSGPTAKALAQPMSAPVLPYPKRSSQLLTDWPAPIPWISVLSDAFHSTAPLISLTASLGSTFCARKDAERPKSQIVARTRERRGMEVEVDTGV